MKVKCDFCDAVAHGPVDQLIMKGWSRIVVSAPKRVTITTCPLHQDEFLKKTDAVLTSLDGQEDIT